MRRRHLLLALVVSAISVAAIAEDDMPFEAYVVPVTASVYSSPEEPRYVTLEIPRGTKVEVYERRGEWLGIRPPDGSYCWVPAGAMTMAEEPGVAEVVGDGVSAWIGSSAQRVQQHHWTIQLQRGELVNVLGTKEVESAEGERETWLKIAPPAGEFRWIHASQVSREAPSAFTAVVQAEQAEQGEGEWSLRPLGGRRSATRPGEEPTMGETLSASEVSGPFRRSSMELRDLAPVLRPAARQRQATDDVVQQAAHQAGETASQPIRQPLSPDGFVPRQTRPGATRPAARERAGLLSPPNDRVAGSSAVDRPSTTAAVPPAATQPREDTQISAGISSAAVQRRLAEIDTALSLMISGDRSQWNLAALKREVHLLVEQGATPVDRGEARFMLEKIARFAEAFQVEDDDGTADLPVGSAAARKAALAAATTPQYDGTGFLTPVRAARPVAPFALLDGQGNRLCYVTPVPGFNLRAYENRQVGLFGKRGYLSDAKAAHVLAERVVDLDKQTR